MKNFFFFFCILPLLVIGKITTYLFFRNSDLKCPKMPLRVRQFHFFQITFFSPAITRTHTPNQTHSVFPTHANKNARNTFFLKLLFFFCLLLLLYPETLPNHLFRQTNDQKLSKKLPKGEKNVSFFYNLFHIFPLPLWKKTKPLTFSPLFITGNRKTARKNVLLKKFIFFFFFTFFHPTATRNRRNDHFPFFFLNSNFKCPKCR